LRNQEKLHVDNGKTISIRVLGSTRVQTTEPENVKAVSLSKDFEVGWQRRKAFEPMTGDGIFSATGEAWTHGRALLRPVFSRTQIVNLERYEKHVQHLLARIPRDNTVVDVQQLFEHLTLDTGADFLFGESLNTLAPNPSSVTTELFDALNYMTPGAAKRIQLGLINYVYTDPKFRAACHTFHKWQGVFIDKALSFKASIPAAAEGSQGDGFSNFLYDLADNTKDRKVLQDQLASVLLAARDTTASLLSSTLWFLTRHPEAEASLRQEIASLNGVAPSYDELKSLTSLRWILNESKAFTLLKHHLSERTLLNATLITS